MCKENSEPTIRPLHPSDAPYLYEICLKTGDAGKNAEELYNDPLMLGQFYAAPYLYYSPDCCFVAVLNGKPCGYILGTADSAGFYHWLEKEWLPELRKRYPLPFNGKSPVENAMAETFHRVPTSGEKDWEKDYPAHLHIDLLPELQGHGMGRKLMNVFLNNLREKGVPGVHLGVDGKNAGALAFYPKVGFSVVETLDWGAYYGQKLL